MPRPREAAPLPRVALAVDDATFASDAARVLAARGLRADPMPLAKALPASRLDADVVAFAPEQPPDPDMAAQLAPLCRAAAEAEQPVVLLASGPRGRGKALWYQTAALAYLRAFGAIVCTDPDVWLETIALIAGHGLPAGPRVAVVAPEGSWLGAVATALRNEAERLGNRFPEIATSANKLEPTDIVLVDRVALSPSSPGRVGQALVVPLLARAELLASDERIPLVGLRAALGAAAMAGGFARRLQAGLGPGAADAALDPPPDRERFLRQIDKLDTRAGDHETKVLLASYGIHVTRQAVATTPSAATRLAKKAGYPVEVKPWGPDQLSEREGCPVQRDLQTAADVRRAVAAVARIAGLPPGAPVIVRETPPQGREVSAHIVRVGALGWMVILDIAGLPEPVAAPAPLGPVDAAALARHVHASRADDPEPDREALASILLRASRLAVDNQDVVEALYLHRIIVTPRTGSTVIADAQAVLVPRAR